LIDALLEIVYEHGGSESKERDVPGGRGTAITKRIHREDA